MAEDHSEVDILKATVDSTKEIGTLPPRERLTALHKKMQREEAEFDNKQIKFDREEIKNLDPKEFLTYMALCGYSGASQPIEESLDILASRFATDIQTLHATPDLQDKYQIAIEVALHTLRNQDDNEEGLNSLNTLYQYTKHEDQDVSSNALKLVARLMDKDSSKEPHSISSQAMEDLKEASKDINTNDKQKAEILFDQVTGTLDKKELHTLTVELLSQTRDQDSIKFSYKNLANKLKLEDMRKYLREYSASHEEFRDQYQHIESVIGLVKSDKVYDDLNKLYKENEFSKYKANQELNDYERTLLAEVFSNSTRVLDVGMGPEARHMVSLKELGKQVVGFDFSPEHVQVAKRDNPDLDVIRASWSNIPLATGSVDGVSFLGRSFAHNTTVDDAWSCLREIHRVMHAKVDVHSLLENPNPPDKEKVLFIDLPQADITHFETERKRFAARAEELGIWNYERGSLVDGPKVDVQFDRMAFLPDQFKAIALLAGFDAEPYIEHEYSDADGSKNVNVYWKLTVRKEAVTYEQLEDTRKKLTTRTKVLQFPQQLKQAA